MPNYEYRCTSCENQFEIWQEVGSAPPPCPACHSEVKKVFRPLRTIYKGSGFYVTDLRAEKEKAATPAPKSDAGAKSDAEKTETKTDTAPATSGENKTESKPEASVAPSTPAPAAPTK